MSLRRVDTVNEYNEKNGSRRSLNLNAVLNIGVSHSKLKCIEFKPNPYEHIPQSIGACIAKKLDPYYCAWDRYYLVGFGMTTFLVGQMLASPVPAWTFDKLFIAMATVIDQACGIKSMPKDPSDQTYMEYFKSFVYKLDGSDSGYDDWKEKQLSIRSANPLCRLLYSMTASRLSDTFQSFSDAGADYDQLLKERFEADSKTPTAVRILISYLLQVVQIPFRIFDSMPDMADLGTSKGLSGPATSYIVIKGVHTLARRLSYYHREISRGLASFIRVNLKRIQNNQPFLNPVEFSKQLQEDIENGIDAPPKNALEEYQMFILKYLKEEKGISPPPLWKPPPV